MSRLRGVPSSGTDRASGAPSDQGAPSPAGSCSPGLGMQPQLKSLSKVVQLALHWTD